MLALPTAQIKSPPASMGSARCLPDSAVLPIAALTLLARRDRDGEAGCTLVALADAAHYFAQPSRWGLTGAPDRMLGGGYALYDLYETAEGWIAVAGLERHFRDTLLAQFPGDASERARLTAGFRTRRADEWHAWAESVDLPIVAVSEP